MSTVHSTPDWDETTCDLSMWDEVPDGDKVLDQSFDPARHAPKHTPCPKCYPSEEAEQRAAFYAHRGTW